MDLKVKKRDGSQEDFDGSKIARAVGKAGARRDVAQRTAEVVENKLAEKHKTHAHSLHIVPSSDIRKVVVEELRRSDAASARAFENFRNAELHAEHQ